MIALIAAATLLQVVLATPPTDNDCGVPTVANKPRIVGGVEATPYSWPWQVQIRYGGSHFCGASIISPDWILTAAHCLHGFPSYMFQFSVGRHSRMGTKEPYEQKANPYSIIMHESYNTVTSNNDVAIIRISPPIKYTAQVKAVCLPTRTTELAAGSTVYVTGWGNLYEGGSSPVNLMQVAVPIIARTTCNQYNWYNGLITNGMICAGLEYGGKDACQEDSGGPLVAKVGNKWEQHGIVSWGSGCAGVRSPGVYTNVVYYNNWIRQRVAQAEREEREVKGKIHPRAAGLAFRELPEVAEVPEVPELPEMSPVEDLEVPAELPIFE